MLYVHYSGHMETNSAIPMFAALAQETRLRAFRLLVRAGPAGMAAGLLSEELGIPHNTMSFHFSHLANAGLVASQRQGRSVIYSANFEAVKSLIGFLVQDCCSADFASLRTNRKTGCAVIELTDFC